MREREIVIRIGVPRVPPKKWLIATAVLIASASAVGLAVVPKFVDNTTLTASALNALVDAVNRPAVTRNNVQFSLGATYCGKTTLSTTGKIGGYPAAKNACQSVSACGPSPTAHMCTSEEIARTAQAGITIDVGWYSSSAVAAIQPTFITDCVGWTSEQGGDRGPTWNAVNKNPDTDYCNSSNPVLCCD
jgi:hypothetical protein